MKNHCNHFFGFDEGFSDESDIEYEPPELCKDKSLVHLCDIKFAFCPLCGNRLKPQEEEEELET